jgi:16S rRNA (uracil1498-N3)-methyltransferase
MADRVFAPGAASKDGRIVIVGDEAHHLGRVRRVEVGSVVEVFDGRGFATRAEVVAVDKKSVELRAIGHPLPDRVAPLDVILGSALPKGDRADWLIEKAAEMGVTRLVPLITVRSVVDPRPTKLDRLRRAAIEAAKQCGRNRVMEIDSPVSLNEFLENAAEPVRLLGHPGGQPFREWLRPARERPATLAIGPEGGFDGNEVAAAVARGWTTVSLGPTLLRIETAALVAVARLMALAEDEDAPARETNR